MKPPVLTAHSCPAPGPSRVSLRPAGFTLVEVLVATTLALLLVGAVVRMFGDVAQSITDSRAMLETADQLRLAEVRLQQDLAGITAIMNPPRRPENNEGYFEYIEGPVTALTASAWAVDSANGNAPDTTVGDFDDVLMFTTRASGGRPFVGRLRAGTIQSDVAEVAWFVRGRTLYRRALLVVPGANLTGASYANSDVSIRTQGGSIVGNTLGDLTRREYRYAHDATAFPFDARGWGQLGLPTLRECSAGIPSIPASRPSRVQDFWTNDPSQRWADPYLNGGGTRVAEDVILNNVIGFDVKAWDPGSLTYVDLGAANATSFANGNCQANSGLTPNPARVYDTYSTSYEGVNASNGFDDSGTGIVDSNADKAALPPYLVPLRGLQVKIRVFEPDSRQVREVTVVQDFLPQ